MPRLWWILLVVGIFCCFGFLPVSAAEPGEKVVQQLVNLFSAWSGRVDARGIYNEAAKYIDYAAMAPRTLGWQSWNKLSQAQQNEYIAVFRKLIEQRYYPRWHKIFYIGHLNYLSQISAAGDTIVKTSLQVDQKQDIVYWRLHPRNGELAVISLAVNNNDLLNKLNSRFKKRMDQHGFNNLLSWLKKKTYEESDYNETSNPATATK